MKEILFLIALFACMNIFSGCVTGRDIPEKVLEEYKLVNITTLIRYNGDVRVEVWEAKTGKQFYLYNNTGAKVGEVREWPTDR